MEAALVCVFGDIFQHLFAKRLAVGDKCKLQAAKDVLLVHSFNQVIDAFGLDNVLLSERESYSPHLQFLDFILVRNDKQLFSVLSQMSNSAGVHVRNHELDSIWTQICDIDDI